MAFMAFQMNVLHHHARPHVGAVVERHALRSLPSSSPRCRTTLVLRPCSPTGPWPTAAGCSAAACSTSPAASRSMGSRFSPLAAAIVCAQALRDPRQSSCRTTRLHAARRRAAVVRLVWLQRRQRLLDHQAERARVRQHAADPALTLVVLARARPAARPPRDRDRRGDHDHRAASGSPHRFVGPRLAILLGALAAVRALGHRIRTAYAPRDARRAHRPRIARPRRRPSSSASSPSRRTASPWRALFRTSSHSPQALAVFVARLRVSARFLILWPRADDAAARARAVDRRHGARAEAYTTARARFSSRLSHVGTPARSPERPRRTPSRSSGQFMASFPCT